MLSVALFTLLLAASSQGLPQQGLQDYDYLYEDFVGQPDFQQPVPQAPLVQRPVSRQPTAAAPRQAAPRPSSRTAAVQDQANAQVEGETTTFIPILKNSQRTDPVTGAFIYDYMGADGSGKYEIRFKNGTVVGNFTFINDQGERETRWYSAGTRGTEIEGSSVISPAPPTLIDETTDPGYVDLSNYELYRHLEVPYVHIEGPSDPDERGQLTNPDRRPAPQDSRLGQPVPSSVPLDFGDDTRFTQPAQPQPPRQAPSRVSRQRVRVVDNPVRANAQFDPRAVDASSPNHVLDSLIRQFQ